MDVALQACRQAPLPERAACREEARELLGKAPVDAPRFAAWVQGLSSLYQNASRTADARSIILEALGRLEKSGEGNGARSSLISALANSWRADGNLLQAVAIMGRISGEFFYARELPDLYRQLGRPEAAAAQFAQLPKMLENDPAELADFYIFEGQPDQAITALKRLIAETDDPKRTAWPLQSLAQVYASQKRYDDAVGAMQQAIAANPGPVNFRQNLAGLLQRAGRLDEADQVYQQLLTDAAGPASGFQAAMNYASYLGETNRAEQAESVLKDYLASHSDLSPGLEMSSYYRLAAFARDSGNPERAEEYRRMAQARQATSVPKPEPAAISAKMQLARTALEHGNMEDAFTAALQAIDSADTERDRGLLLSQMPDLLTRMAAKKEPARAEQLYQRLFATVPAWNDDQSLLDLESQYIQFLTAQPERYADVPTAIARYRDSLIAAHGADSNAPENALRMTINFERYHGSKAKAVQAGEELLRTEESLSGNTSEPYLGVILQVAELYEVNGNADRALALRRRAVTIADLALAEKNPRRASIRMDTASALARAGRLEEAEKLRTEAAEMGRTAATSR